MAIKLNKATGELNAWMPDLTILARGKSEQELKTDVLTYMKEYYNLATKNGAKIPLPSSVEIMLAKWKQVDGYVIDFICLDELDELRDPS